MISFLSDDAPQELASVGKLAPRLHKSISEARCFPRKEAESRRRASCSVLSMEGPFSSAFSNAGSSSK